MTSAVCTLFEGHYHLGAAALINSLWDSGFRGRMLCGYRGELPPWATPSQKQESGITVRHLGEGFEIWFVPLETKIHLTNYKPTFLREQWDSAAGSPDAFFYLDPDIVIKCPWKTMERWADSGVALSEDVNFYLPPRHPLRTGWMQWLRSDGVDRPVRPLERYYSAGFIGVPRGAKEILSLWEEMVVRIGNANGTLSDLKSGNATSLFHTPDQDALNISLMCSTVPINGAGWESMDFAHGGNLLSHAIGGRKPWRGGFVGQALKGYPPSTAHKVFFDHVDRPIPVFSPSERARLRRALNVGAFIGRFYRRA